MLDQERMPRHVAIIMDGNGRWAKNRGLPRLAGHNAGMKAMKKIVDHSDKLGIRYLTVYAFSTENWKRPESEIDALMGLFMEYFLRELAELHANGVCIRILGEKDAFAPRIREAMATAEDKTAGNAGLTLNIALNYGSRAEVVRAVNLLVARGEPVDEPAFMGALYTAGLPDLDLVIRTGGEQRLSNFLLLQAAYAELVFVGDYFPDFTQARYADCLREYQRRSRRFGDVP